MNPKLTPRELGLGKYVKRKPAAVPQWGDGGRQHLLERGGAVAAHMECALAPALAPSVVLEDPLGGWSCGGPVTMYEI